MRRLPHLLALGFALTACTPTPSTSELEEALEALVDSVAATDEIPGALLHVYAPEMGLDWAGGAGISEVASRTLMAPGQTVRNASNTKTYVAAAVLRLWESGRLELDAPVRTYLDPSQVSLLSDDGYDADAITLRHLLTHTSGLVDHGSADEYFTAVVADPSHRWTRDEQLAGAVAWGDPLWPAGDAYSYSDTGYILLGQVLERVTGQELGPAVRDLVGFDDLGLHDTWWELMEPAPSAAAPRAHQYADGVDTNTWNPSLDSWGGGGLVTSSGDLAMFWYHLFNGRVFENDATLDTMLTTPLPVEETPYRMGVSAVETAGFSGYGHSGFWGTNAKYIPDLGLAVAGAVTEQSRGGAVSSMVDRAIQIIATYQ